MNILKQLSHQSFQTRLIGASIAICEAKLGDFWAKAERMTTRIGK
jgi:hypothetical protein